VGTRNPHIRAVPDDPTPPKPTVKRRSKSVDVAAAGGDHLELLVAMRDRIAKSVASPDCPPRDLAALTRRLQEIAKDIAALKRQAEQEGGGSGDVDGDEDWDPEAI
jgi:hypothetical protein